MRNKFTGYFKNWDRCEDCGQRLHRHGETGLRHSPKGDGSWTGSINKLKRIQGRTDLLERGEYKLTGLDIHDWVLAIKQEIKQEIKQRTK